MMNDDGAAENQLDQTHQQDDHGEEQGGEGDSFDPEPWKSNPSYHTRQNTPTKKPACSACWKTVKRLASDHPKASGDEAYTHVCTEEGCSHFFKLHKIGNSWANNPVVKHLKTAHPTTSGASFLKSDADTQVDLFVFVCVLLIPHFLVIFSRCHRICAWPNMHKRYLLRRLPKPPLGEGLALPVQAEGLAPRALARVAAPVPAAPAPVQARSCCQRSRGRSPRRRDGSCTRSSAFLFEPSTTPTSSQC